MNSYTTNCKKVQRPLVKYAPAKLVRLPLASQSHASTFAAVIDYFAIDPRTKAGHLSHGQRAGLHLAMTLAIEPELLMLDDPATGLDPAARRSLLEAMIYFTRSRARTIFFSTHLLDDVERVANHVAVLDYSVLRACCGVETFRDQVRRLVARFPALQSLHRLRGFDRRDGFARDSPLNQVRDHEKI